jgi:hypothetical protein
MSPAFELGRSFVQPAYQRGFAPLLVRWRGIGAYVAKDPRFRRTFGTVSISADHQPTSVRLMVDHLRSHCLAVELAPFVRARRQRPDADAGGPAGRRHRALTRPRHRLRLAPRTGDRNAKCASAAGTSR